MYSGCTGQAGMWLGTWTGNIDTAVHWLADYTS